MDDVIQLLVFFVTIVIFIVSAVFKQKKKPEKQSSNFESLIETFLGVSPENQSIKQVGEDVFEVESEKKLKTINNNQHTFQEEGIDAIPDSESEIEEDIQDDEVEYGASFNLKQAVIYSEILKRKTF